MGRPQGIAGRTREEKWQKRAQSRSNVVRGPLWAEGQRQLSSLRQRHPNHRACCTQTGEEELAPLAPGCLPLPTISHNGRKERCPRGNWELQRCEKVPSGPKYTTALSTRLHSSFAARPLQGLLRNVGGGSWVLTTTFCATLSNGLPQIPVG